MKFPSAKVTENLDWVLQIFSFLELLADCFIESYYFKVVLTRFGKIEISMMAHDVLPGTWHDSLWNLQNYRSDKGYFKGDK